MTDDIRVLSAQWASDPASLVFLRLGTALLAAGRAEAAEKVALQGLARYPNLPDAHDLYARVRVEQGDLETAFDEWDMAVRLDPGHQGAHKGLGYLYFKAGDFTSAQYHLELADAGGEDPSVGAALERVRERLRQVGGSPAPAAAPGSAPPASEAGPAVPAGEDPRDSELPAPVPVDGPLPLGEPGLLLVDTSGLRLEGRLMRGLDEVSDQVAAELAGVSREAVRAAKLLQLGEWQSIAVEAAEANFFLVPPTPGTLLLVEREAGMPMGRIALAAMRARDAARQWLERGP